MCTNPGCCGGEDKFTVLAFDLSAFPRGLGFLLLDNVGMFWSLFLDHGGCQIPYPYLQIFSYAAA
jgi:hypothetical protein